MMRLFSFCFACLLMVPGVHAENSEEQLSQWLAGFRTAEMISGTFEQSKHLPLFSKPLISTGAFYSLRDKGLVWEIKEPAPSKLVMTPGRLVQLTHGRRQEFKATGTGYDGLAILLPALLDSDLERLQKYFTLVARGNQQNWSLTLTPFDDDLVSMVTTVEVAGGGGALRSLRLTGASGDVTEIVFPLFMTGDTPGEKELAAFE